MLSSSWSEEKVEGLLMREAMVRGFDGRLFCR